MDEILQLYMSRNFDVALQRSLLFLNEIAGLDHSLKCKGRSCACFPGVCITLQLFAEWLEWVLLIGGNRAFRQRMLQHIST